MTDLELLAKGLFERYSLEKEGRIYNWDYLHIERKVVWMNEVLISMDYLLNQIRTKVDSVKIKNDISASYAIGYSNGMWAERNSTITLLGYIKTELKVQLEQFKSDNRRKLHE
jgi:hypothetical protein